MTKKPFKTIDEQMDILISRNLEISSYENARDILLRSNYYNLINGYHRFIFNHELNRYYDGASLELLYEIYNFDKQLKSVFYPYIMQIETYFSTICAYYFGIENSETDNYLKIDNFSNVPRKQQRVKYLYSNINVTIDKNYATDPIKHYLTNHDSVPLWVLVNFFDLGMTINFFFCLKNSTRHKICTKISETTNKEFGMNLANLTPEKIDNYLFGLKLIRNIIAHDNRLLQFSFSRQFSNQSGLFQTKHRNSIYDVLGIMKLFLPATEYMKFISELKLTFQNFDITVSENYSHKTINIEKIFDSLGFPSDWHKNN